MKIERAQCIVPKGNKLLMVKLSLQTDGHEFWCLPGGHIEEGETPAEAAVRELKEECCVEGKIVREMSLVEYRSAESIHHFDRIHSFLMDIGSQEPAIGIDPGHEDDGILDVKWLTLAEIPERDRAYLWAAGLMDIREFFDEVFAWGDSISYPVVEKSRE